MIRRYAWLLKKADQALRNPFRNTEFNPTRFRRTMEWDPPERRYVIFFTPRSGSSRITDLAKKTGALGDPGECFNPDFLPDMGQAYSARNMAEYIQLLIRQRQTRGTFGCEVTWMHVVTNFLTGQRFFDALQPTATAWLIREDIVSQAVSVSRMVQTRVSHTATADPEALARADDLFTYRPEQIANVMRRLRWMEAGTERFIARAGLEPLRLSYEQSVSMSPRRLMAILARHVGAVKPDLLELSTEHRKISTGKSEEFAERFRREHPEMMARIDAARAPLLAAHAAGRID